MLTIEKFLEIPAGEIFAEGVLPNSPEGLFITQGGGLLRWVAIKGYAQDWAVYCHWEHFSKDYVAKSGDKVTSKHHVLRCVPCDEEVWKCYRF